MKMTSNFREYKSLYKKSKNVMIVGKSSSGKSSLIVTLQSLDEKKIVKNNIKIRTIESGQTTLTFNKYKITDHIYIFDTIGFLTTCNLIFNK
jgi:ribosome biogenesis GTPase A